MMEPRSDAYLMNEQTQSGVVAQPADGFDSKLPGLRHVEILNIYENRMHIYLVGCDSEQTSFSIIKLDRTVDRPASLAQILQEDTTEYSANGIKQKIRELNFQEKKYGGLSHSISACGLLGFVRFKLGYYLVLMVQNRQIGSIGGNPIYGISSTQILPVSSNHSVSSIWSRVNSLFYASLEEEVEARYLGLFHFMDLTKDFYFSYTYDVTKSLQRNMVAAAKNDPPLHEPQDRFLWSAHLNREFSACLSSESRKRWLVHLAYGFYGQRKCSMFGRAVSLCLIARRSRFFAGTRYLKRGVNDDGKVGNDVEYEQIIEDESLGDGRFSSFVQYRGSLPVHWSQETSVTVPKPEIKINRKDPTYTSTKKHFMDLIERYGSRIIVLNLVKLTEKREREVIVGEEFAGAVQYLNSLLPPHHRMPYIALDHSKLKKRFPVLHALNAVAVYSLKHIGFFCCQPIKRERSKEPRKEVPTEEGDEDGGLEGLGDGAVIKNDADDSLYGWKFQRGILRTNCIDCLDRTNVAQYATGARALGEQLLEMGFSNTVELEPGCQPLRILMNLYQEYSGSEAHKKEDMNGTDKGGRNKRKEFINLIKRYYSNSFTDRMKQDSINLFLGYFVPWKTAINLWELETDYYLHNLGVSSYPSSSSSKNPLLPSGGNPAYQNRDLLRVASQQDGPDGARAYSPLSYRSNGRPRKGKRRVQMLTEDKWWELPLQTFMETALVEKDQHSAVENICKENFYRRHFPSSLTSFDDILSMDFMVPVPIARDNVSVEADKPLTTQPTLVNQARAFFSVESPRTTEQNGERRNSRTSLERDDGGSSGLISGVHSLENLFQPPDAETMEKYARAEQVAKDPTVFEKSEPTREQMLLYERYLHDFNISENDPVAVRRAQLRAGVSFQLQSGPFKGLPQNIRAAPLVAKMLKEDEGTERFYGKRLNPSLIASNDAGAVDSRSQNLYRSFFGDGHGTDAFGEGTLPDGEQSKEASHDKAKERKEVFRVGRLFRYGRKEDEYILFNDAALHSEFRTSAY